jgi:chemosensory pili system protein ChpA (sensor histidine kinase/response regulator)
MLPEPRQDRSALRWIRGELDQNLRQARATLEDFAETGGGEMNGCADLLHQVHGALEMVQVYGAAMLADEMERLARALAAGQVKRQEAAAEALMLGMVQLPAYLEKVEAGGADVPLILLPLMNDLRAARDAPLVSETSLFAPKLNTLIAAETVRPGSGNRELPGLIHQLRSQYHRGLLSWIRNQDPKAALGTMRHVLDRLNSAAGTARLRRLLDAAEALTIALADEEAPALAVKPLFGKLDMVFKRVIDQGEEAAMLDFPVDLLKNLLYYIARSNSRDPAVVSVQQAADLVNSFPDPAQAGATIGSLGAPDRELFDAVGDALAQDLRAVKDQLDLYIRGDRTQLDRLTGLVQPIHRIGDTLAMVGRGDLRTRLKRHGAELEAASEAAAPPDDERLMALASELLYVESALSSLGSGEDAIDEESVELPSSALLSEGEMRLHQRAAVDEALVEMARTKDDILAYLESPLDTALLAEVPRRLHLLAGVLSMLQMTEAGRLLLDLKPYLERLANGEPAPDAAARDAMADVITSAEIYLHSEVEPGADRARLVEFARQALAALGLGEAAPGTVAAETVERTEPEVEELSVSSLDVSSTLIEPPEPGTQREPEPVLEIEPELEVELVAEPQVEPAPEPEREAGPDAVGESVLELEPLPEPEHGPEPEAAVDGVLELEPMSEPGPEPTGTQESSGSADIDSEILEVFAEEADEELQSIQQQLPAWLSNPENRDALQTTRRSFHTLKGSGRLVGASVIGEFAWAIENLLNRVIDGTVAASAEVHSLMQDVLEVLPGLVSESTRSGGRPQDVSALEGRAFALAAGDAVTVASTAAEQLPDEQPIVPAPTASDDTGDDRLGEGLPAEAPEAGEQVQDESILTAVELQDSEFAEADSGESSTDSSLQAVFLGEAEGHLRVLEAFVSQCRESAADCVVEDSLRRAMHTLRGSARTAGVDAIAELAAALETLTETLHRQHLDPHGPVFELLVRSRDMLAQLAATHEATDSQVDGWQALREEILQEAETPRLAATQEAPAAPARPPLPFDPDLLEVFLDEAKELLETLDGEMGAWEQGSTGDLPVARLQRNLHTMKGGARLAGITAVGDLSHALESVFESVVEQRIDGSSRLKSLVRQATDLLAQDIDQLIRGELPGEHATVVERLEAAARAQDWEDLTPDEAAFGAESALLQSQDEVIEESIVAPLYQAPTADDLEGIEAISELTDDTGSSFVATSQMMTDSELLSESSTLMTPSSISLDAISADEVEAGSVVELAGDDAVLDDEDEFVPRRPLPETSPAPAGSGERVRVASEALDQMVNNAGEVSIYRARIEQQNSSVAFNLGELQQTTDRLRSQLRSLELETEAQILSRHEREHDKRDDFDPLELDRYSTMQQLSRALSETVEDLSNLGRALNDLSRDTDTLLLQQARVTTDLQDGLLRTRMVRFSSRVARLERVVRQTAHGLGKQAKLEVIGGHEDMDRAILERMMGPLEHLLRNAVSHGIESPEAREAAGKRAQGLVTLELVREGTDVVLTLSDDGAGLDRDRIREKAVERGLIEQGVVLDDDDLFQLILQPGFSTAAELSQVSGRGVGMDVVLTEVKQLGGTLEIDSQPGHGTSFTVRLPFTLAITDALLVVVDDDYFAVPHSSMDGVARIGLDELRRIYAGEQEFFSHGGRDYTVRYLGSMLGMASPVLPDAVKRLPLLLVRSGEHRVAIQVDSLLGNRQIVVKSIGAQLSGVRWFTGGTILADGQIALILDTGSLVRMDSAQHAMVDETRVEPSSRGVSVMVVDDSITVRKVTTRLLERHNMHVVTAKDGVDAVTLLQETQPDVMLLDIEMPRMDGFELARHMRASDDLKHIPIIMITSRSGDKHRQRAFELGVSRYLGKPYQESELLENIYTVLADAAL